ncbi:hypothetical protein VTK26DRAFT_9202 [Humicola hyalothermophila]
MEFFPPFPAWECVSSITWKPPPGCWASKVHFIEPEANPNSGALNLHPALLSSNSTRWPGAKGHHCLGTDWRLGAKN